MTGMTLWLLAGAAAGLALIALNLLVTPVVGGWRPAIEWLPGAEPGTLTARLVDNVLALALIAAIAFALRAAGVV